MVKEFSIFLENAPGILSQFIKLLNACEINIRAISVVEADKYGLVLILVDKPDECKDVLEENGYEYTVSEVVVVGLADDASLLFNITELMGISDINIEYLYSTLVEKEARLILKTNDNHKAINVLKANEFSIF